MFFRYLHDIYKIVYKHLDKWIFAISGFFLNFFVYKYVHDLTFVITEIWRL